MILFASVKFKAQIRWSTLSFFCSPIFKKNWCILKWKCHVLKMLKRNLFSKALFSWFFSVQTTERMLQTVLAEAKHVMF